MSFDYLKYKPRAINFLSEHLKNGTLVLFLGSGASKDLGLPNWLDYVNRIRLKKGMSKLNSNSNSEELQIAIDEVKDQTSSDLEYFKLLKETV